MALAVGGDAHRAVLAAALGLAACAHRPDATTVASAPVEGGASARQARENAALRRRIEMLEDRVLHLEQGDVQGGVADADSASQYSLPDGRVLPVVRLDAPSPESRRRGSDVAPAPAPSRSRAQPDPDPEDLPARPRSRGTTLTRAPVVDEWSASEEPESLVPVDREPASGAEPKSYRLVGARLVELTQAGGPKPPDRKPEGKKARGVVAEYEAAMAVYQAGALGDAQSAFDAFAREHPRHDYADNALYWKGEAAYDQAHYADALDAFTEVVERYGGGNKAADALLKIGLCYRELGDEANARDVLTQLIDAYPGERASDIARVKLAEFGT